MVEDISLVLWALCFGKGVGVISYLFGPVRGYRRTGPQCLPTSPGSASSIYAAIVYVSGARVSLLYLDYFSCLIRCEFKNALSNSLIHSLSL